MSAATNPAQTAGEHYPRSRLDTLLSFALLGSMAALPVASVLVRLAGGPSLSAPFTWTQTLNLWLAFFGTWLASRRGRHLALSTAEIFAFGAAMRSRAGFFCSLVALVVTLYLSWAAFSLVLTERSAGTALPGGVPVWLVQSAMPLLLAATLPSIVRSSASTLRSALLLIAVAGMCVSVLALWHAPAWTMLLALLCAMLLGAPLYIVLGGAAAALLGADHVPLAAIPTETYALVASPNLPSLPLFTLTGYLLAEGGASRRLVALFDAWFGWLPGGIAIATVLVCAFFTTFTGASGVTILALGGLLLPALLESGFSRRFAIGLLTASGSIGLLFPPSLPVILYGVVAQVPIDRMFVAAWKPGALLLGMLIGYCLWRAWREGIGRREFDWKRCWQTLLDARHEIALPLLVLLGFFGGWLTILEASAVAACYALLIETVLHRDLSLRQDVPRIFRECVTLMGGVLIILGMAMGLTNYLIDAEVPQRITGWVSESISNRILFIAFLNVFLLGVGCMMDIFSAIMVVVPLIVPLAHAFGIDPMHLGVLFLANLELGYLTPPVGMNLFLSAFRFNEALASVYRMTLPFCAILLVGVLVISYTPSLAVEQQDSTSSPEQRPLPLGNIDLEALLAEPVPVEPSTQPAPP